VVSLSDVKFVSSVVLSMIISIFKEAKENNGILRLAETPPEILAVIKIARLDELIEIYSSEEKSLKDLR